MTLETDRGSTLAVHSIFNIAVLCIAAPALRRRADGFRLDPTAAGNTSEFTQAAETRSRRRPPLDVPGVFSTTPYQLRLAPMATARSKPAATSKAASGKPTSTHARSTRAKAGAASSGRAKARPSFSAEEREAMRERAREARSAGGADGEAEVLAKIAAMAPADRAIAERLHALIRRVAPNLVPKTWYGMPAYALDGKTLCFFQAAARFKTRYATFGFSDAARLDEDGIWPTAFALARFSDSEELRIAGLLRRAMG